VQRVLAAAYVLKQRRLGTAPSTLSRSQQHNFQLQFAHEFRTE
jgi:hypothetical protein